MFTYLDPDVRRRLVENGHLIRIGRDGATLDASVPQHADRVGSLDVLGPIPLPVHLDGITISLRWYAVVRTSELARLDELADALRAEGGQRHFASLASSMAVNSVLMHGEPTQAEAPLVRIHSSCLTGDVFGSQRCECGPQFVSALERISNEPGGGLIVYMAGHEGRGIGLWAKAATYLLQDQGENTYQANRSLGLPDDSRDFSDAATLLHHFIGNREFRLLTNNPKKLEDLAAFGLEHVKPIRHVVGVGAWNRRYLAAKRDWGHAFSPDDIEIE